MGLLMGQVWVPSDEGFVMDLVRRSSVAKCVFTTIATSSCYFHQAQNLLKESNLICKLLFYRCYHILGGWGEKMIGREQHFEVGFLRTSTAAIICGVVVPFENA